nr:PREDICTED: G1/S-specific cyclin-E2 [Latimeria chalumnae]|eukprot:XP_014354300.1 PREDICTED: G1/S-specific cyclin-E2 [Latimeria chalumnae]
MSRRSGRLQEKNAKIDTQKLQIEVKRKRSSEECIKTKDKKQLNKKIQRFEIQNCWAPNLSGGISPCVLIETPHKEIKYPDDVSRFRQYRFTNLFLKSSPLPFLSWGNSEDVWSNMLKKEIKYVHEKHFFLLHPALKPHMRSILLDWLLEVCEVHTLHRETFYLAQDFFDRFMFTQTNINKNQVQLIGITSLFIAAKLEEIYPPKLHEFAYITDGACTEEDILDMELIILKVCCRIWFSCQDSLLDLCILDDESLDYQYGVLAAAALYHFTSFEVVLKASVLEAVEEV